MFVSRLFLLQNRNRDQILSRLFCSSNAFWATTYPGKPKHTATTTAIRGIAAAAMPTMVPASRPLLPEPPSLDENWVSSVPGNTALRWVLIAGMAEFPDVGMI
jgi:hypothetical protein